MKLIGKSILWALKFILSVHIWIGGGKVRGLAFVVLSEILALTLLIQMAPGTSYAEYNFELAERIEPAQPVTESEWDNINAYLRGTPLQGRGQLLVTLGHTYKLDPDFIVGICLAESSLGKNLSTTNNFGNVGNNDRGHRQGYETPEQGLEAIYRVLNNKYLGNKATVGEMSGLGKGYIYASGWNWERNVLRTMTELKGQPVNKDYNFRR